MIIRIWKLWLKDFNWGSTRPTNFYKNILVSGEIALRLIAKHRDRAMSQQLHQIIYGNIRTYLNKIFKFFQITYYILPVSLCFWNTCTDTAESKNKKQSILNEDNIVLINTKGKRASKNVLSWWVKRWVLPSCINIPTEKQKHQTHRTTLC